LSHCLPMYSVLSLDIIDATGTHVCEDTQGIFWICGKISHLGSI